MRAVQIHQFIICKQTRLLTRIARNERSPRDVAVVAMIFMAHDSRAHTRCQLMQIHRNPMARIARFRGGANMISKTHCRLIPSRGIRALFN